MYIKLSDEQWDTIEYYLPPINHDGRPRSDDRKVINGILYVLKTGCQWPVLPKEYGVHYSTCWRRLKRWEEDGVWHRIINRCHADTQTTICMTPVNKTKIQDFSYALRYNVNQSFAQRFTLKKRLISFLISSLFSKSTIGKA